MCSVGLECGKCLLDYSLYVSVNLCICKFSYWPEYVKGVWCSQTL